MSSQYVPIVELTRGRIVESIHFGAFAVVDASGKLVASHGDPQAVSFLRSSAKPFQALPFVERGGPAQFGFTQREVAIMCASHSGTDEHVAVVKGMQAKIGVGESDLMCGTHYPDHNATADAMLLRGEVPTACRHNCSGKHTGMLAHAKMRSVPIADYVDFHHPIQESILQAFSDMTGLAPEQVELGVDGCSAPNFAVPLYNAALGFARLCDPSGLPETRAKACAEITAAMMAYPDMVGGPERFDTLLMQVGAGRIVAKGGAEGYQAVGLMPGALGSGSPGFGIAVKISDGDSNGSARDGVQGGRARHLVALEILRQLGALDEIQYAQLAYFGHHTLSNWRKVPVGEIRPAFSIRKN